MNNYFCRKCPLCNCNSVDFYSNRRSKYFECTNCKGIFVDKQFLPTKDAERKRYEEHNNDVNDIRYQTFVQPFVDKVSMNFHKDALGLDFGAGAGPIISMLLKQKGYNILQYDPIFHNYPQLLEQKYDYIVCCEVIEHFHNPKKEFELLKSMLKENGILYCMTSIYNNTINFNNWYYKNDNTHVFIYQKETLEYVANLISFSSININGNFIEFFY